MMQYVGMGIHVNVPACTRTRVYVACLHMHACDYCGVFTYRYDHKVRVERRTLAEVHAQASLEG